ncbi:MAG TPA: hypothetical protein VFE17_10745 [Candidatus Baltobacteraceae bacterium]|jgi:hypothetical protein|nr:hypothetical protein [Candidatus Baltobacteraceae bacterium]
MLGADLDEPGGHRVITTVRHIVEIVAIIAAGVWAFYTFIYEERIKPAHEPLSANESISLTRVGRLGNLDVIAVAIVIKNVGKTEFDTVALAYDVTGFRFSQSKPYARETASEREFGDSAQPTAPHLLLSHVSFYAAAVNGPLGLHNIIDPGGESDYTIFLGIPHGRYGLLKAHFQYLPYKTPVRTHQIALALQKRTYGAYDLYSEHNDVLEDNVFGELALTQ